MKKNKNGFTLIELLVVIVLMGIIFKMSVPMFIGMSRGAAIKGGVRNVMSTLSLARQYSITHRINVGFYYYKDTTADGVSRYYYRVCEVDSSGKAIMLIQQDVELPGGVIFDEDTSGTPWHMASSGVTGQIPFGWLPGEILKVGQVVWNNSDIICFNSTGGLAFNINNDPEIHLVDIKLARSNPNHKYKKVVIGWLTGGIRVED